MKKITSILLIILISVMLSSCNMKNTELPPDITQVRSIAELATVKCYYHNVAKTNKKAGAGLFHLFEKDKEYWVQYSAVVRVGVDLNDIKMENNGEKYKVIIPEAKVLDSQIDVDSLYLADAIVSSGDGINKNLVTADEQTKIISDSQTVMEEDALANKSLFINAEERVKELLKNYFETLNTLSDKKYEVVFEFARNTKKNN